MSSSDPSKPTRLSGSHITEQSDYDRLKRFGHSSFKAGEIALDVQRGDAHARRWIALMDSPQ